MSLRTKILLVLFFGALLPLVAFQVIGFRFFSGVQQGNASDTFAAIADEQEERIEDLFARYRENIAFIIGRPELRNAFSAHRSDGADQEQADDPYEVLNALVADDPVLLGIRARDAAGEPAGASMQALADVIDEPIGPGALEDAQDGVAFDRIIRSRAGTVMRFFAPMREEGRIIGFLELYMDASPIEEITGARSAFGNTGESLLARRPAGGGAEFITSLRFHENAAFRLRIPEENAEVPINIALDGLETALHEAPDYRQEPVLATVRFIEEPEWGLVVKMDRDEVLRPIMLFFRVLIGTSAVIALALLAFAHIAATRLTASLARLKEQAERLAEGERIEPPDALGSDEIAVVARAFNDMAEEVLARREALESAVTERTQELSQAMEKVREDKRRLAEASARLHAIINGAGVGLVILGPDSRVEHQSDATEEMLGHDAEGLYGMRWFEDVFSGFFRMGDEAVPASIGRVLDDVRAGSARTFHAELARKDGGTLSAQMTLSPIFAGGELINIIAVFQDISREREVDRAKTEFVTLASHQLRTPLTAINWYAESLLEGAAGELNAEQREMTREIMIGSERLGDLVRALLNVSRLEAGVFDVEPEPVALPELAGEVIDELQPMIRRKRLRFQREFEEGLPRISADRSFMRIILDNLLSNAVKYTPEEGEVKLSVGTVKTGERLGPKKARRDGVYIKVSDSGIGIAKKDQERVFARMFRADDAKELDTDGIGLGLYLVEKIAEAVGGDAYFTSRKGRGSTFYAVLPMEMEEKRGNREPMR